MFAPKKNLQSSFFCSFSLDMQLIYDNILGQSLRRSSRLRRSFPLNVDCYMTPSYSPGPVSKDFSTSEYDSYVA